LRKEIEATCAGRYNVKRGIFVEVAVDPSTHVSEAKMALKKAQDADSFIEGVVAAIPVPEGGAAVRGFLDKLRVNGELPKALKGGRIVLFGAEKDVMLSQKYTSGLEELQKHGLLWEWCGTPDYLPGVLRATKRFPKVSFVLNHLGLNGGVGVLSKGMDDWKVMMTQLAAECPNLFVKMGAIEEWSVDNPSEYLRHGLKTFGTHRCLAEANWFVSAGKYPRSFDRLHAVLEQANASDDEVRDVFQRNAEKVYCLEKKH